MSDKITATIEAHFGGVEGPRRNYLNDRPLINILTIALCATIAGAVGWVDIENFGKQKRSWLNRFLGLSNGIPIALFDEFGLVFESK